MAGDSRTKKAAKLLSNSVKHWNQPVWCYTHTWRNVHRESWGTKVSILASCESITDAKIAMNKGYAVARVTPPHPSPKAYIEDGVKVIPCPAQTHDNVTCVSCKLCWNDQKLLKQNAVIAFEAHGVMKRRVLNVLQ